MSITYNSDGTISKPMPASMMMLMLVNATASLAVLGAWTYVSKYVADPIAWATWVRVYRTGYTLEIFEYPFVLLWLLPVACVALAWTAHKAGYRSLAWTALTLPLALQTLIITWFHVAPPGWR